MSRHLGRGVSVQRQYTKRQCNPHSSTHRYYVRQVGNSLLSLGDAKLGRIELDRTRAFLRRNVPKDVGSRGARAEVPPSTGSWPAALPPSV